MKMPKARLRYLALCLGTLSLLAIVSTVAVTRSFQTADQISGSLAGMVLSLALIGVSLSGRERLPLTVADIAATLAVEVERTWSAEIESRGLSGGTFAWTELSYQRFSTPRGQLAGERDEFTYVPGRAPFLTFEQLQTEITELIRSTVRRRVIFYGPRGSGKSTLALALSLGLLRPGIDMIPLLLPAHSWSPDTETFRAWLQRQLTRTYESTGMVLRSDGLNVEDLLRDPRIVLILDGFDELGDLRGNTQRSRELAVALRRCNVVIFTRRRLPENLLYDLPYFIHAGIAKLSPDRVADYIDAQGFGGWRSTVIALRSSEDHPIKRFFATPHRLSLAVRLCRESGTAPKELLMATEVEEARGFSPRSQSLGDQLLYSRCLEESLRTIRLPMSEARFAQGLQRLARSVAGRTHIAWWRIIEQLPGWAVAVAGTVLIAPAYLLSLSFPPGLTRGFAIGLTIAGTLSLSRGTQPDRRAPGATALCSIGAVLAVGVPALGLVAATSDAVQIASSLVVAQLFRCQLAAGRWPLVPAVAAVAGLVSASATTVADVLMGASFATKTFPGILASTFFGVVEAAIAWRLLVLDRECQRPSLARARRLPIGEVMRHFAAGLGASMSIGVAAGIVGLLSRGLVYGIDLVAIFGVVLGTSIGLAAGGLRCLTARGSKPVGSMRPIVSLNADRIVAVGTVVVVGLLAAASIFLLSRAPDLPLRALSAQSSLPVTPVNGYAFGLSIGITIAGFYSAWPAYVVANAYLVAIEGYPLFFLLFLRRLHAARILYQDGPLYRFTDLELQTYLAESSTREILEILHAARAHAVVSETTIVR